MSHPLNHTARPAYPGRCRAWGSGLMLLAGLVGCLTTSAAAVAQTTNKGRYFPNDHTVAPGTLSQFSRAGRDNGHGCFQPVRFELPGGGIVSAFERSGGPLPAENAVVSPAQFDVLVGSVYRFKLSQMPDYPGLELYPTLELIDRLHPPPGREAEFPVPVILTAFEVERIREGALITKVIYLEQPDLVGRAFHHDDVRTRLLDKGENALEVADDFGRPIAILRVGGRKPNAAAPDPAFFGMLPPLRVGIPVLAPRDAPPGLSANTSRPTAPNITQRTPRNNGARN